MKKQGLSKRKGKKPTKKEQAVMLALFQLGKSTYEIGMTLGRSHHTVGKYVNAPLFSDPKFQKMVDEYKEKEILDLTVLSIKARARLHDLVPTAGMIESIALMDRSFQQRRLLEGKSTENIFSLRRIIQEAHSFPDEPAPLALPEKT